MARRSIALLTLVALTLSGSALAGDDPKDAKEQSRTAFRKGVAKLKEEKFTDARDQFLEAYKLFPHPSILLNLGLARIRLAEWADAEQDLTKFIADDGGATADEIQSARSWLAEARDHLGSVKLQVSPDKASVTLDKKPVTITPGALSTVRATAGMHQLHVEADGFDAYDEFVTVVAKEDLTRRIALYSKKTEGAAGPSEPPKASGNSDGLSGGQVGGIVLLGTSAVFLGAGIFCGISAMSYADHYNKARIQKPDDKDTGIMFRTVADIGFAGAIVAGAVGTYLVLSGPKKKTVTAGVGPSSLVIRGEF